MADAAWLVSVRGGDNNVKKRKDLLPRRSYSAVANIGDRRDFEE